MQLTGLACALLMAALAQGQPLVDSAQGRPPATPAPFHWHDDYTEYHLLEPATHQFHIVYFLNQRQAGLTYVLNQTRSGSEGSGISVSDPRTGEPLKFDYLTGKELAAAGVQGRLNAEEHYIRAHLPRPVPAGGEGRVRIEKTYKDEKSYFSNGKTISFARSLGIGRNAIVLPAGFKLVSSNVAAIVESLEDGRIRLSFENINGYASDVNIRAAKSASVRKLSSRAGATPASAMTKTLYEIHADGTLALTHQFVALRGDRTLPCDCGPAASVKALDMDTGEEIGVDYAPSPRRHGVELRLPRGPATVHVRIRNNFKDPQLAVRGEVIEWARELREPRATIVLPPAYELGRASMPVTMGTLQDGRVYLQVVNNRPGSALRLEIRATK